RRGGYQRAPMTIDPHPSAAGTPTGQEAQRSAAFAAQWARFTQRLRTDDSLRRERRGFRRWMLAPYIAFVIPIDDADVRARLAAWQNAFADMLPYQPQPVERLHITLHYVGQLRTSPWLLLPNTWMRAS